MHDKISKIAYFKWEKAGYPQDKDDQFWLEAEKEVQEDEKFSNEIRLLWTNTMELKEQRVRKIWQITKTFL